MAEMVRVKFTGKGMGLIGGKAALRGETHPATRREAERLRATNPKSYQIVGEVEVASGAETEAAPSGVEDSSDPSEIDGQSSDLTQLRGIGPQTEIKLNRSGITTFTELSAAESSRVAKVTGASQADVERWLKQAAELASKGDE